MNQLNSHRISFLSRSIKAQNYLIKLTPFLVSLSLITFIVSPSSLISFLHHFNFYFSTFSLQLFTHTIDKNCMFLICNGLLVFVGITRSLSWSSSIDESSNYVKEPMLVVKDKTNEPNNEENIEDEYTMEIKYSSEKAEEGVEEEKRSSILVLDQEEGVEEESRLFGERNEEEDKKSEIVKRVENEEVLEEANLVLSTEELNKKFDDFIKKMKKDLRIEAQK
ncbi:hypothetical protein MtrunA17_Chr3g0102291 [Medicago truncatula]|uniref:Transmembrane protein, putative n=1 Tax=Medicago truncatula TaxID=3880 RepID=I3SMV9_MEDTR|nr:uncharacterized protein LOC25489140 [Medicago truncatula]AFK41601.1 unknown [Medicago truncatula]KEH34071.1 transmembrane protein, putative [Medicago truncatula]RHN67395.1 hypothetical protein MtrunA17_Chr3g0102291 [Medicago truncatula]